MRFPVAVALLLCAALPSAAQTPNGQVYGARLKALTRPAGRIFSGQVLKVEYQNASANSPAVTMITLRVENAVRGVRTGQTLQIREWALLWNAGERFREGEHVFLFLYPDSRLGLTSPVAGDLGHYTIDRVGRVGVGGSGPAPKRVPVRQFMAAIRHAEAAE